jgi:hypothetical protein
MPLHKLYDLSTGQYNPGYLTGVQPGGAGVQVAGVPTTPGISAPRLEESTIEVLDVTAPTLLAAPGTANYGSQLATPAASGKLLVISPSGAFGARWKLNSVAKQAVARGQYGIVFAPGAAQVAGQNTDAGPAISTAFGNEATYGTKAVVLYDGPVNASVQTSVGGVGISAGQPLVADGAGNLTGFSGAPVAGTILGTYLGPTIASGVSLPVLAPVYLGGY